MRRLLELRAPTLSSRRANLVRTAPSEDQKWRIAIVIGSCKSAKFNRKDFEPNVAAHEELVEHFCCAWSGGLPYAVPRTGSCRSAEVCLHEQQIQL